MKDIITSKTFDNGVICASEQSIIVEGCIYDEVHRELEAQGAYFMNEDEAAKMAALLLRPNGTINPKVVGKTALYLSQMAGFCVPASTKVLIAEQTTVSPKNPYSREKLCPVLGLYVAEDWKAACHRVVELLTNEGLGHTLVIHTRSAAEDTLRILREENAAEVGGVFHCFTETLEVARAALDLNFSISFSVEMMP